MGGQPGLVGDDTSQDFQKHLCGRAGRTDTKGKAPGSIPAFRTRSAKPLMHRRRTHTHRATPRACSIGHAPTPSPAPGPTPYRWCSVRRSNQGCTRSGRPCRCRARRSGGGTPSGRRRRPPSRRRIGRPPTRRHRDRRSLPHRSLGKNGECGKEGGSDYLRGAVTPRRSERRRNSVRILNIQMGHQMGGVTLPPPPKVSYLALPGTCLKKSCFLA